MRHWFACEIEEIVRPAGSKSPTVARLDRGFARSEGNEAEGFDIEAGSEAFDERLLRLGANLERASAPDLSALPDDVAIRVLSRTTSLSRGGASCRSSLRVFIVTANGISIVATQATLKKDLSLLRDLSRREPLDRFERAALPIAWQNGAAAVLLHEAIGHPAERGLFDDSIPSWLNVDDSPSTGELVCFDTDDTGATVAQESLTSRRKPSSLRRWSHRDVPARRMSNLVVRGSGRAVSELPRTRIDILFVAHGWWDPGTDTIGVRVVAADLVEGRHRRPLEPFSFTTKRLALPSQLSGWFGAPTRYPGVLCGDEGTSLPVGSASVGLLLESR